MFTDYLAMQSCTSGRTAFFTGMYPLRTGMIPPQLPGAHLSAAQHPTLARVPASTSATPPASSARTIWATTPIVADARMAFRNSGVTSITSTPCGVRLPPAVNKS